MNKFKKKPLQIKKLIVNIHTRFYMIKLRCLTKNRTILDQNKRNKPNILVYSTVLKSLVNFKSISLAMMFTQRIHL